MFKTFSVVGEQVDITMNNTIWEIIHVYEE